jgi:hypothetical protein
VEIRRMDADRRKSRAWSVGRVVGGRDQRGDRSEDA